MPTADILKIRQSIAFWALGVAATVICSIITAVWIISGWVTSKAEQIARHESAIQLDHTDITSVANENARVSNRVTTLEAVVPTISNRLEALDQRLISLDNKITVLLSQQRAENRQPPVPYPLFQQQTTVDTTNSQPWQ